MFTLKTRMVILTLFLIGSAFALYNGIFFEERFVNNSVGKEKLVMGVSMDYPPFEFFNFGKPQGYDIDLAYMLAEDLGFEVEIKDMDFSSLIPALNSKQIDFIISSMSPTPKRAKNVDFTRPYYVAKAELIVHKPSDPVEVLKFKNKTIGAQTASTMEEYLNTKKKEISTLKVVSLARIPTLVEELKSGRLDGVMVDTEVARKILAKNSWLKSTTVNDFTGGNAVVLPLNSPLTAKFNKAIEAMEQDGRLKMLEEKWLVGYYNG